MSQNKIVKYIFGKDFGWIAACLTLLCIALNAYSIVPYNNLVGILGSLAWCVASLQQNIQSLFWLNVFSGLIYFSGFIKWAYF